MATLFHSCIYESLGGLGACNFNILIMLGDHANDVDALILLSWSLKLKIEMYCINPVGKLTKSINQKAKKYIVCCHKSNNHGPMDVSYAIRVSLYYF